METSILLSLGAVVALLIHFVRPWVSGLITRRCNCTTNILVAQEESAREKEKAVGPTRIFIPNIFAQWPWPRQINPHYAVVKKEADAWITSFQVFSPKAQDAYNRCDCSRSLSSNPVCIQILFDRSPRLFGVPYSEQR